VYPALAVLQALQRESDPSQLGGLPLELLWVGGEQGLEEDWVKRENIPFQTIPAAGVHGVGWRAMPANLARLARGYRAARRILQQFRPSVLFFTGGYLAVPMALAARMGAGRSHGSRPRSLVYVPDIQPGWALKTVLRMADHAALTVAESRAYVPSRLQATVTGYPLRQDLTRWTRAEARQKLNLTEQLPVFLVMGGSRGARSINQALFSALPQLLERMQVLHISGQQAWEEVERARQALPAGLAGRYHPYPYLHAEIGAAFAAADLALSRAGASSLGEFPAFRLPAILVPYPYAWRYQRVNADYLVRSGAAMVVEDADLLNQLAPLAQTLMADGPRRQSMADAMQRLAQPGAARSMAEILLSMAEAEN
jgi:UDP-N-acetylglucosamine--N-acetylmuramyl-(pentapeptide) pyrophosphoryl-undecaprenol N-acetylglucosamine transferase